MGASLIHNILESGQRDSNARHQPWQGRALPLSYARLHTLFIFDIYLYSMYKHIIEFYTYYVKRFFNLF